MSKRVPSCLDKPTCSKFVGRHSLSSTATFKQPTLNNKGSLFVSPKLSSSSTCTPMLVESQGLNYIVTQEGNEAAFLQESVSSRPNPTQNAAAPILIDLADPNVEVEENDSSDFLRGSFIALLSYNSYVMLVLEQRFLAFSIMRSHYEFVYSFHVYLFDEGHFPLLFQPDYSFLRF